MPSQIDKAITSLRQAHKVLSDAGSQEQFFSLAIDVGAEKWGRFFGRIEGNGFFLEFKQLEMPQEVELTVGIIRNHKGWFHRLKLSLLEFWSVFRNKTVEYTVSLSGSQLTDLKHLLRSLEP